jgi:hypothetical protein
VLGFNFLGDAVCDRLNHRMRPETEL